jgi:hypothetical protein
MSKALAVYQEEHALNPTASSLADLRLKFH